MANDPTVKAGSWGPKTVEKILRIQERALELRIPMVYLVDSAGARITEQVQMFPGRRGAGRIFHNQVKLSGLVPQVCVLFGPSAAGGAYIPAFCDIVIMREGNASMYLGSPRMAEMVIGEKVTLEQMGGARMHTGVSGCAHQLVASDADGIHFARRYLSYLPEQLAQQPPLAPPAAPVAAPDRATIAELIPADENKPFDIKLLIDALVDAPRGTRGLAAGDPAALGQGAGRRLRAPRRSSDRDRRQPAQAQGRRAVQRLRRQGRALHLGVQRVQRAAAVPRRRARLHDRHAGRARGHHPPRRQDDQRSQRSDRAEDLRGRAQGLRRRALRDGRSRVRPRLLSRAAERVDRRDGPAGRDQRRLLQPAAGDRRRARARRRVPSSCAASTPRTSTSCTSPPSS